MEVENESFCMFGFVESCVWSNISVWDLKPTKCFYSTVISQTSRKVRLLISLYTFKLIVYYYLHYGVVRLPDLLSPVVVFMARGFAIQTQPWRQSWIPWCLIAKSGIHPTIHFVLDASWYFIMGVVPNPLK